MKTMMTDTHNRLQDMIDYLWTARADEMAELDEYDQTATFAAGFCYTTSCPATDYIE